MCMQRKLEIDHRSKQPLYGTIIGHYNAFTEFAGTFGFLQ